MQAVVCRLLSSRRCSTPDMGLFLFVIVTALDFAVADDATWYLSQCSCSIIRYCISYLLQRLFFLLLLQLLLLLQVTHYCFRSIFCFLSFRLVFPPHGICLWGTGILSNQMSPIHIQDNSGSKFVVCQEINGLSHILGLSCTLQW